METSAIHDVIFQSIDMANHLREDDKQIPKAANTDLYGEQGHLDSMGLVALLVDIEELLLDQGIEIMLSDERAMSQKHSPFKDVSSLTAYIQQLLTEKV